MSQSHREVSPADLLFYAERVRALGSGEQVAERADLIAEHIEWHARCLLVADILAPAE